MTIEVYLQPLYYMNPRVPACGNTLRTQCSEAFAFLRPIGKEICKINKSLCWPARAYLAIINTVFRAGFVGEAIIDPSEFRSF
ncbi:hypothetical protein Pr1d_19900 [Bythopirellula goksoeyrii]|uniref:Uncharacterized protein n=1 Tax=Bythopirellula goksoeyrii TaxID=1400387 RepID=A0A5B9Q6R5_9BACT|nr:hypothetical protein Pr1d_19900 [Bythopirellula goksoeyrii]